MVNIPELLRKKRDGEELSNEEIESFVSNVAAGNVQESQIGAMLMAIYLRKLSHAETVALTAAMMRSGDVLEWDEAWSSLLVDKHSTGGVGDKVSLVLAPALAACGFKVPMMSGRGLEFTGGTLDKMESIPGFRVQLNKAEMDNALQIAGCFIAGPTACFTPADLILYKTRDVTSTVDDLSLTTASIVCKKVAEGVKALVMDIKVGRGAFFKNVEDARLLANSITKVSAGLGLPARAVITRMDVPLGCAVGNALEVAEAIECMKGGGPKDLMEVIVTLGGVVLEMKGRAKSLETGKQEILKVLESGKALHHFHAMLLCQGVSKSDATAVCHGDPWSILPSSPKVVTPLLATQSGIVADIRGDSVARACWHLGAGRSKSDQPIEPRVGVVMLAKLGEPIMAGQPWIEVHHMEQVLDDKIREELDRAIVIEQHLTQEMVQSIIVEIM